MSFLDDLCAEEMAEGHEEHTGHDTGIKNEEPREDGYVLAYCTDCSWEMWGRDIE